MFGHRYFGSRYFAPRYFGDGGGVVVSATPTPQGATGPGGPSFPGWGKRFKGSKQTFADGVFTDADEGVEEFGVPKAPQEVEPTVAEVVESLTAPPGRTGQEVIAGGVQLPTLPPLPVFPPKEPDLGAQARKRKQDIAQFNAAVLARIIPELGEW